MCILHSGVGGAIVARGNPVSHETILVMVGKVLRWRVTWHTFKMAAFTRRHVRSPLGRVARLDWSTASP